MRWWGNVWASVDGNRDASMVARSACLNRSTLAFVLEQVPARASVSFRGRPSAHGRALQIISARAGRSTVENAARPGADGDEHPVDVGRVVDLSASAHPAHLAPPHPAHEEEPRDHRVDAAALEGDLLGLASAAAPARSVAGGEDVGQVRGPERPRLPPASTAGPAARSRTGELGTCRRITRPAPGATVAAPTVLRRRRPPRANRPARGRGGGGGPLIRSDLPPPPANASTATPSTSCSWRSVQVRDRSPTC